MAVYPVFLKFVQKQGHIFLAAPASDLQKPGFMGEKRVASKA